MNTPDTKPSSPRLVSVDALRGFDMFWIIGADALVQALNRMSETPVTKFLATQMEHVEWEGFHFYDLIFPLFLFIVGVSIVLSMDRMLATHGRKGALIRIAKRSVLLFVLGIFYYNGLTRAWPDVQVSGVLPRIALCYFIAATLYVLLPRKGVVVAAGNPLMKHRYHRSGFRVHVQRGLELFSRRSFVRELSYEPDRYELSLRLQWV